MNTPLDSHFGDRNGANARRRRMMWTGILGLALVPFVGTALSANISLNSGTAIEFGQGAQITKACDTSISSAISENWYQTGEFFRIATIELSTLNVTVSDQNDGGCGGKNLKIQLLDSSGTPIVIGDTDATSVTIPVPTTNDLSPVTITQGITAQLTGINPDHTVTITIPSARNIDAVTVARIAIETQS